MAAEYAHGAVQWLAADAATTVYTISGLSFQPKALRFFWQGLQSTVDAGSAATHLRRGEGYATGTSSRRCVATQDQDNAATMTCTSAAFNDCVAATVTSTPARDGALDINSFTSDGFTLIVDDATPVNVTIFWEAYGGADVIDAGVGDIAEPSATGNQDYATGGVRADVVMIAGVQSTAAVNTAQRNDSGLFLGRITGSPTSEQTVNVDNNDDGSNTSDVDRYARGDECLAMITVAGGNPSARAVCTLVDASIGFRLNWTNRATTDRRSVYMWIRGGSWKAGELTIDGQTLNTTASVTGLWFQPKGLSFNGQMRNESAAGTSTTGGTMTIGCGSSTSSRRSMGHSNVDGAGNADINLRIEYDEVLVGVAVGGGSSGLIDIDAILTDGFRLIVDEGGGSGTAQWIGYLAFGDNPLKEPYKPEMQRGPVLAQ